MISVLEILKLRRVRWRQLVGLRGPAAPPDEAEVDEAVQHELDTGTFQAVDPTTGEMAAIDPDTGEIEAITPSQEPEQPAPVPDTDGSSQSPGESRGPERPRRS